MAFEYISHTADVSFKATSSTLEGAFSESARAVTHVMTDDAIKPVLMHSVSATADNKESLLFDFLSKVILLLDTDGLFVSRASLNITRTGKTWILSGMLYGDEAVNYERHGDVKAPTYHGISVKQEDGKWVVEATLDI